MSLFVLGVRVPMNLALTAPGSRLWALDSRLKTRDETWTVHQLRAYCLSARM